MSVKIYEGKFEKVVKYYYPYGEEYNGTVLGWYLFNIFFLIFQWIFFPIFWLGVNDNEYRGKRKVYYVKIKEKK